MLKHDENGIFALKRVAAMEEGRRSLALGFGSQVILLDLVLPDVSGLQTLRRNMPHAQDASVVVITGRQDQELGIAALIEGAPDYLIKGHVDGRQLRRILRYAIERHKIQNKLRAEVERRQLSEQRSQLLSDTAPIGILTTDAAGKIIDANAQALRMFSYGREELIGETIETLLPERLRHSHRSHHSGFINNLQARPMGLGMARSARRKHGTECTEEIGLGPMVTKQGVRVSTTIV